MGGNPIESFSFVHKHGLVSSKEYPYTGFQHACHKNILKKPMVFVNAWGVLTPKDEKNMERVLRHVGPVAAGLNGSEKSFLHYKGGIFNSKSCHSRLNHALLIVGYGEENISGNLVSQWQVSQIIPFHVLKNYFILRLGTGLLRIAGERVGVKMVSSGLNEWGKEGESFQRGFNIGNQQPHQ